MCLMVVFFMVRDVVEELMEAEAEEEEDEA